MPYPHKKPKLNICFSVNHRGSKPAFGGGKKQKVLVLVRVGVFGLQDRHLIKDQHLGPGSSWINSASQLSKTEVYIQLKRWPHYNQIVFVKIDFRIIHILLLVPYSHTYGLLFNGVEATVLLRGSCRTFNDHILGICH